MLGEVNIVATALRRNIRLVNSLKVFKFGWYYLLWACFGTQSWVEINFKRCCFDLVSFIYLTKLPLFVCFIG